MTGEKMRNPLLVEEDWWTVWFGLTILLIATVLGILTLSGSITAKNVPKIGKWSNNPGMPSTKQRRPRLTLTKAPR